MPIPSNLVTLLATAVDAMSIAGGFNFDYGPVDIHRPADRVYPQVFLEYDAETEGGVQAAGHSTHALPVTFKVFMAKAADMDAEGGKFLDDIKKMLNSFSGAGFLYYENERTKFTRRLVYAYPLQVEHTFDLVYRQDRANPAQL